MNRTLKYVFAAVAWLLAGSVSGRALAGPASGIDTTFNAPKGYQVLEWTVYSRPSVPTVVAVLAQRDGKIIVVGNAALPYTDQHGTRYSNTITVTRLLSSGQLDPSFGVGGVSRINSGYQGDEFVEATAATLDPNGRIAIAGFHQENRIPKQSMAVWVLNPSGYFDTSFGNGGERLYDRGFDWAVDRANGIVAFTPNEWGTALYDEYGFAVVGETRDDLSPADSNANPGPRRGLIFFLTPSGADVAYALNRSFRPSVRADVCPDSPLHDVAARHDAESSGHPVLIYAVGDLNCNGTTLAYVFRLTASSGAPLPDASFGLSAISYFAYSPGISSTARAVAIDPAGRPIVAGSAFVDGGWNALGVARLTSAGQFDTTFSGDGTRTWNFESVGAVTASGVALQHDGKILVGGGIRDLIASPGSFFSLRLRSNGDGDASYTGGSYLFPQGAVSLAEPGAHYYQLSAEDFVYTDDVTAAAMDLVDGEKVVLAGSAPERGFGAANHADAIVLRLGNDGIFADGLDW